MISDLSFDKAYNYAVYLLGLKLRTEGELREKMRLKKYNAEIIDAVIYRLLENNYIDDLRYAEIYLDNLKKYKSFGFYGIKKKLMEKRLPSDIIERVLAKGLSADEETKIAKRFMERQENREKRKEEKPRNQTASSGRYGAEQKLASKLKARGFRGEVIAKLVF